MVRASASLLSAADAARIAFTSRAICAEWHKGRPALMHTVLVLGGYGFFGQRISAALASTGSLRVLIAGRDLARASATARSVGSKARITRWHTQQLR
jgi:glutamyl-tRNA reductase